MRKPKRKRILRAEEYINSKYPTKLRKIGQNSFHFGRCGKHGHNRTCNAVIVNTTADTDMSTTNSGITRGMGGM